MFTKLICVGVAVVSVGAQAELGGLYRWFHSHPELSYAERETSKRFAGELRAAGFEVTENVGGFGVVAVLKNGEGKTVLFRSDLDALPVKEEPGLTFASRVVAKDEGGKEVSVMHACGHDVHMTSLIGAARELARRKNEWRGTLVLIGQPAEERLGGAVKMLKDGLFKKFPRPDFCLALHVAADQPVGTIGFTEGATTANIDSVDIVVRGVGGHGAWPHKTKDPVVLAAEIVLALQTIVSREIDPTESAVVTVGSIHGGAKRNVISDQVVMELTLRSYSPEVRKHLIAAIRRKCDGLGRAAGLPEDLLPVVTETGEAGPAVVNDAALAGRVVEVFKKKFGEKNVLAKKPVMGSEDFSEYGRTEEKIPIFLFWLGTVSEAKWKEAETSGKALPSLHSPFFAPDAERAIKTGMEATVGACMELLEKR